MTVRFALASTAALALAACGGTETADETVAEATPTDVGMPDPSATPDTGTPQGFIDTMAASDLFEIEAGRIAQELGESQAIKDFGAMMVRDHTASSDKLRAAVADAGLAVAPELTALQQGRLEQLRGAGENFDAMYAQQQVNAHEAALSLLRTQAESGTLVPLKAFAAEAATVVEGHLARARELP